MMLALAATLAISGCGTDSADQPTAETASTAVTAAAPDPAPESPSTTPDTSTPPSPTPSAAPDPQGDSTTPPPSSDAGPTGNPGSTGGAAPSLPTDRELTIDDIFKISPEAREGTFDVATTENQKGIGITIFPYSSSEEEVELRLGNRYEELTFTIGQDNNSETSDMVLKVEIEKNGTSDDFENIPFNQTTPITVDVRDVNALKIILTSEPREGKRSSDGKITAVLYSMKVR